MSDLELLQELIRQIEEAIARIERRFIGIECAEDFISSEVGIDKLDSISMMLIWIGESIKKLEKCGGKTFLAKYPDVDWKGAKGTRDILSHHYGDVDAEVVFHICSRYLPEVKIAVQFIKQDLEYSDPF
ncbi:MAG: HepT-like ribonuclease domain-containing protein [Cyanobacteria bacterium J06642_2]